MTLEEFLANPNVARHYIQEGPLCAYVRKTRHYINGGLVETFDIANVSVEESARGAGIFTAFLDRVERLPHRRVYVESVVNMRLEAYLQRRGYEKLGNPISPNFLQPPQEGEGREAT